MNIDIKDGVIRIIPETDFEEDWIENCAYENYTATKCYMTEIGHCGEYLQLDPVPPKEHTK